MAKVFTPGAFGLAKFGPKTGDPRSGRALMMYGRRFGRTSNTEAAHALTQQHVALRLKPSGSCRARDNKNMRLKPDEPVAFSARWHMAAW
jgi:hypothetical protein